MFSRRTNSNSRPSTEKKSLASRFRPLFKRSRQITPQDAFGVYYPDVQVPSSSAWHHLALPVLPLAQTPLVVPSPTMPPLPQGVHTMPYVGSTPAFSPVIPLSASMDLSTGVIGYPQTSLREPALRSETASLQPTSRSGYSSRSDQRSTMSGTREFMPVVMPSHSGVHLPPTGPVHLRDTSSSAKVSRQAPSSRQISYIGLQMNPSVSAGAAESSLYMSAHDKELPPRRRKSKVPSAEYLATPLLDNPLGLTGMVLRESYVTPQEDDVMSRTWYGHHANTHRPPGPAVQSPTASQAPNQGGGRKWERDAYSVNRQHLEDPYSSRKSTSRNSQEYTARSDRHLPTARSRSVTVPNATTSTTHPTSIHSSRLGEIVYLVEQPVVDLYNPLHLEPVASAPLRSHPVHDRRLVHPSHRGS